jgi:hypothetical protein
MVEPIGSIYQDPDAEYDCLQMMKFHDPTVLAIQSAALWLKVSCSS